MVLEQNLINVSEAHTRIKPYITNTPLLHFEQLDAHFGFELYLKPELFQSVRAFKIRGAFNFVLKNKDIIPETGLITHSSGNHGQALAYVGKKLNIPVTIIVPENAPKIKVAAMKKLGASLLFSASNIAAREDLCAKTQKSSQALFVPPYDHMDIIEGQGTAAYEALQEVAFDSIITPIGGGGLLAGTCIAAKNHNPKINIFASEPKNAADAHRGLAAGKREERHVPDTIADGLRTTVGINNFEIIKEHCKDIWLCSEEGMFRWGAKFLKEYNLLLEPSSTTVFAALYQKRLQLKKQKVLAILTGGNVAPDFYVKKTEVETPVKTP